MVRQTNPEAALKADQLYGDAAHVQGMWTQLQRELGA